MLVQTSDSSRPPVQLLSVPVSKSLNANLLKFVHLNTKRRSVKKLTHFLPFLGQGTAKVGKYILELADTTGVLSKAVRLPLFHFQF